MIIKAKLLVFVKEPCLGFVKTRMMPIMSDVGATALHCALFQHFVDSVLALAPWPAQLQYCLAAESQGGRPEYLMAQGERYGLELREQVSGDLGAKMSAAVLSNLSADCNAVVLLGADCPFLSARSIDELLAALAEGCDAAIIPALDGGYVALALNRHSPRLFEGIDWGSNRVLGQTLQRLVEINWRYKSFPALADIDRPEDLLLLAESENLALRSFAKVITLG